MDRTWRPVNLVCELPDPAPADPAADRIARRPTDPIRPDLLALFEQEELLKYLTDEELDA